jgi:hypothetical protein
MKQEYKCKHSLRQDSWEDYCGSISFDATHISRNPLQKWREDF